MPPRARHTGGRFAGDVSGTLTHMSEPPLPAVGGPPGAEVRDDAGGDDAGGDVDAVDVALPEDLSAPGQAREVARDALRRWRLPGLLDSVVLAVSELVTNAVRHGRPPVRMVLHLRRDAVRVDVRDAERGLPGSTGMPGDDAESGRGGAMIADLADESGVQAVPDDGKVVHATFVTRPPSSSRG